MNPWLETAGAVLLAAGGFFLAYKTSKLPGLFWVWAYFFALAIIAIFGIERYTVGLEFIPPFSWVAAGRTRYILAAFAGPLLILTAGEKLPRQRDKIFLRIFTGAFLISSVVMPFFLPALIRDDLAAIVTKIDRDGVCLQQTGYTCGPAAAVTGLRRLGIPADEGQIAIWSHTSQFFGTIPDEMAGALRQHYSSAGLQARYEEFKNISDLQGAGVVLAVIKFDFFVDHFVTILAVNDHEVIVGDPLNGKETFSHDDFAKLWRFSGVALKLQRP